MTTFQDLTGTRFGRLLVLRFVGRAGPQSRGRWACVCTCGTRRTIWGDALRAGLTRSCGCLRREESGRRLRMMATVARTARGDRPVRSNRHSPEYSSWLSMKQRCLNSRGPGWRRYGGRGITIDPRWIASFDAFYDDLGPRPVGTSLDRIDNDGPYISSNCRWTTTAQQRANQTIGISGLRGDAIGTSKLTAATIREIRARYAAGARPGRIYRKGDATTTALARAYGVSQGTIWRIVHREAWGHVT
jgi:hypothetical protein